MGQLGQINRTREHQPLRARCRRGQLKGERGISGDTALRLARYFSNTPEFWINLQGRYELEMARYEAEERIEEEVKPRVYA